MMGALAKANVNFKTDWTVGRGERGVRITGRGGTGVGEVEGGAGGGGGGMGKGGILLGGGWGGG
jgi:hypothetical protein